MFVICRLNSFRMHRCPLLYLMLPVLLFFFTVSPVRGQERLSVLALGDSYTIGESVPPAQRWPVQLSRALRDSGIAVDHPRIIAKTGWTTTDLRAAIDSATLHPPYSLVTLLIGVNDQYDGLSFDRYPQRFEYLLQRALSLAGGDPTNVVVVSIPDYSVTPFGQRRDPATIARELARYNSVNHSIARRMGVHYVNITPGSRKAASDRSLIADDGLHPSGRMYRQWVRQIVPVIYTSLTP